jgi:hypothetical protein
MQNRHKSINQQKGAALILMAFIIGLASIAYLLHTLDPARLRAEQDRKTMQSLNAAKQALIAWSVNHPNTPGLMPYPDRNNDGNYDDTSDCYAPNNSFDAKFTIGRLPLFKSDPNCVNAKNVVNIGVAGDFRDGTGERLWYEVSRNLLHDYDSVGNTVINGTSPIINPSIVNTPTHKWFIVRDRNGAIISDRVAAVIIAPGSPSGIQDRSGGINNADAYLDKIVMADGTPYKNYTYYDPAVSLLAQEFIIGDDYRAVAKNDPTYKNQAIEPYYYNDKLVYITIDELMAAIEKRAGEEVRANLTAYAKLNGNYPFAANLGGVGANTTRAYRCSTGKLIGALPVDNPADTCTYSATATTVNSTCSFQNITSVAFRKSAGGNFTSASPACTFSGTTCTCTGTGSCSVAATTVFSCDALGNCNSPNSTGRIRFLGTGLETTSNSPVCSLGALSACAVPANTISRTVTCNGVSPTVTMGYSCTDSITTLPAWFKANRWQDYVFYEMKRPTNLVGITVGNKSTGAAVVTTGAAIAPQVRLSCLPADYLDSAENISINSVYEATSKLRANNYNDQTFVVSQ